MTANDAYDAIAGHFRTAWGSTTPIADEDSPFDPTTQTREYVRFLMQQVDSEQASIGDEGGTLHRVTGLIWVQVYALPERGGARKRTLADMAVGILARYRGAVWLRNPQAIPVGTEGRFARVNVSATFSYDQLQTP